MDKNSVNKSSNFFRKEGFYVILFVCLCIVATVAVVTSKSGKPVKNHQVSQKPSTNQAAGKNVADKNGVSKLEDYDNALQVKKDAAKNKKSADITVPQKSDATSTVSNIVDTKFTKPVEGTIARHYSEDPVPIDSYPGRSTTFLGMDIQAKLGTPVVAVLDGKVVDIDTNSKDGVKITIDHQNGLKTVYGNLDTNVLVTKGQSVKKGTQIGKVGNTTLNTPYEKYGDHLYFEVMKGNEKVNPERYIKY